MPNPDIAIFLADIAEETNDLALQELNTNMYRAFDSLVDAREARTDARTALLQSKHDFDIAYAHAVLDATESSKEKREAAALLATEAEAAEYTADQITFATADAAFEDELAQWKLVRHILTAKYGGLAPFGEL